MLRGTKNLGNHILILGLILCLNSPVLAKEINIAIIDSGAKAFIDSGISFTSISANHDPLYHGTEVAKLIRQGNPDAKIYMLQVCENIDGVYKPSRAAILKAIEWIFENRMDIVNLSLVTKYDKEIEEAIAKVAEQHGTIFVAAAGNKTLVSHFAADTGGFICKVSKGLKPAFPASSPHVISVGAIDNKGKLTDYSHNDCDIYALGITGGQEGTSFASARISSEIASLISHRSMLSKEMILNRLGSPDKL